MTSIAGFGLGQGTATVSIGTVSTVPYDQGCGVSDSGMPTAAILDFSLASGQQGAPGEVGPVGPTGETGPKGDPGDAATIAGGTATSTAYGNPPQVTNSGTSSAAVFDFVIPAGQQGEQGPPGAVTDPLVLNELRTRQVQGYPTDNPPNLIVAVSRNRTAGPVRSQGGRQPGESGRQFRVSCLVLAQGNVVQPRRNPAACRT